MREATVRDATLFDLLPMAQMAEAYYAEATQLHKHTISIDKTMSSLAASVIADTACLRLLIVDGKIAGGVWGVIMEMPWSDFKFAQDIILYVKPEYRGYGKLLISSWESWASDKGAGEVSLSTASGLDTDRTCRLYSRYGYKMVGHSLTKEL